MLNRASLLFALAVPTFAFSQQVSGTWNGTLQMDTSKIPAEYREKAKASMAKLKVTMIFKSDKTFTSTASGSPDGKSHTSAGTWSQKGNSVSIMTKTYDGKTKAGEPPRSFTLSGDGKTMTMSIDAKAPAGSKAPQSMPSIKLIFKRKG